MKRMNLNWTGWALASLLCMGVGNFFGRLATQAGLSSLGAVVLMFYVNALLGTVLWVLKKPVLLASPQAVLYAGLGGLGTGLGLLCLIVAFGRPGVQAGVATALMNANFALVALLGYAFLAEALSVRQWVGLLVMLAGLALLV